MMQSLPFGENITVYGINRQGVIYGRSHENTVLFPFTHVVIFLSLDVYRENIHSLVNSDGPPIFLL